LVRRGSLRPVAGVADIESQELHRVKKKIKDYEGKGPGWRLKIYALKPDSECGDYEQMSEGRVRDKEKEENGTQGKLVQKKDRQQNPSSERMDPRAGRRIDRRQHIRLRPHQSKRGGD